MDSSPLLVVAEREVIVVMNWRTEEEMSEGSRFIVVRGEVNLDLSMPPKRIVPEVASTIVLDMLAMIVLSMIRSSTHQYYSGRWSTSGCRSRHSKPTLPGCWGIVSDWLHSRCIQDPSDRRHNRSCCQPRQRHRIEHHQS